MYLTKFMNEEFELISVFNYDEWFCKECSYSCVLSLVGHGLGPALRVLASLPEPPALCPLRWLFFTPIGDCFVIWPAEHGILDLATDQLCGPGQVTVALCLSCHLCKMIVGGVGRLFLWLSGGSLVVADMGWGGVVVSTGRGVTMPGWPCLYLPCRATLGSHHSALGLCSPLTL